MKLTLRAFLVAAIALSAKPVFAQGTPPPTPPPGEAPPPTAGPTNQPPSTTRPKLKVQTGEEEGPTEEEQEAAQEVQWGVGARARFITLPAAVIELFVEHATSLNSVSFAGSVIRRRGNFDIVFTLEYANVSPKDGLYEEKGEMPSLIDQYPDYVQFDNLSLLSGDVSFIWHTDLTDFMKFRYGAGIGIGVPLGGYTQTDTMCDNTTTIDDLDDPNACARTGQPEEGDIPPVVPVVNLLLGLRFKVADQLSIDLEVGWRLPAFFAGLGVGYFF